MTYTAKIVSGLLSIVLLFSTALAGFEVTFLDVGNGDAAIVTCDGESMIIDGGPPGAAQLLYARARSLKEIRYVVATHPHDDHIGGLASVFNAAPVGVMLSPVTHWDSEAFRAIETYAGSQGASIVVPSEGDVFALGSADVTILHCYPEAADFNINDMSICLRVDYGDLSVLFTGDAEATSEYMMIDSGLPLQADILKVGHHGSDTSSTAEFIQAVSPSWAVISVGEDNDMGLPSPVVLETLALAGVPVLRTDYSGTITWEDSWDTSRVEDAAYIGNRNSKKFHRASCPSVDRMNEENKVGFSSRNAAILEGYEPCKNCRP